MMSHCNLCGAKAQTLLTTVECTTPTCANFNIRAIQSIINETYGYPRFNPEYYEDYFLGQHEEDDVLYDLWWSSEDDVVKARYADELDDHNFETVDRALDDSICWSYPELAEAARRAIEYYRGEK